jgi:hypothetical protein
MKQVVASNLSQPEARADEELVNRQLARDFVLFFFAAPFRLIVVYSF